MPYLVVASWLVAASARAQVQPRPGAPQPTVSAKIDAFRDIVWRPADNYFQSPGPVRITLSGYAGGESIVLTADDAEGKPEGEISVKGRFSLRRSDALMQGSALRLNAATQTGSLSDAEAHVGALSVKGASIEMSAGRWLVARHAHMTTCSRPNPDYLLSAREIRLSPTGMVKAQGVTLTIRGSSVLAIPYLEKSFRERVESPFPLPSYSKETGPKLRVSNEALATARSALTYSLVASLRRAPYGAISYEADLGRPAAESAPPAVRRNALADYRSSTLRIFPSVGPGPIPYEDHPTVLFATLGANEYVNDRLNTDLRLSRLPEIGVASWRAPRGAGSHGLSYHWEVTGGHYRERPSSAACSRAQVRAGVATSDLTVAPAIAVRVGLGLAGSAYDTGATYALASPEAEVMWRAGRGSYLAAAYRRQLDGGTTPFTFDRLDVRNEVRLRYDGDYARWGIAMWLAYDADRWRAYDTSVSVLHRLDCMEFGLAYRSRSQGLGVVFNLLPGDRAHDAAAIGDSK